MSTYIKEKIAWVKSANLEHGYRRRAILNEIAQQERIIGSYAGIVNPNPALSLASRTTTLVRMTELLG